MVENEQSVVKKIQKSIRNLIGYQSINDLPEYNGYEHNPNDPRVWILGDPNIGEGVWVGRYCLIDSKHDQITIGSGCNISSGAQILTHSTVKRCITERNHSEIDHAPTSLGKFCFVGTNATILMGAEIGDHSVIGAGAVVTEFSRFPPDSLIIGVPAKRVGSAKEMILKEYETNK